MDKHKYIEKYLSLLTPKQFKQVDSDPTKTLQSKVQRSLWKLKSKLSPFQYKKLHPTGSSPGKFYGTTKLHKLPANGEIDNLPIRPIVSNINSHISVSEAPIESIVSIERIRTQYQKYKRLHSANKKRIHISGIFGVIWREITFH